jgi:Acylamino-acid-releasing enzyme, N-terminal domain
MASLPKEVPTGMDAETALLEELLSIPQLSKAMARPAASGQGIDITVTATQHNLPANAKRTLTHTLHVPDPACPHGAVLCGGLPAEPAASLLHSVSPSGAALSNMHTVLCLSAFSSSSSACVRHHVNV